MNTHPIRLLLLGLAGLAAPCAHATPVVLDDTFGNHGITLTGVAPAEARAIAHLPLSGGGSVAVIAHQYSWPSNPCPAGQWCLALLTPNGGPPVPGTINFTSVDAAAIDAQGRIVVVGSQKVGNGPDHDFRIARINIDGTPDASFGYGGQVNVAFDYGGGLHDAAHAVAIDGAGRIVIAGTVRDTSIGLKRIGLVRLTPAGAFDTTWCPSACNWNAYPAVHSGRRVIYVGTSSQLRTHEVAGVAVGSDNRVLVSGDSRLSGVVAGYAARLAANGEWTHETELNGGVSASGSRVRMGGIHVVSPNTPDSDLIVTGVTGLIDQKLFFAQRLDAALWPVTDWGSSGAANSVAAFSATFGFLGDPGEPIPGQSAIDTRGRILMAGAVNVPTATDAYAGMAARLATPSLVFRDGFE